MIRQSNIIFESGKILNSQMLQELQNSSLRNLEIQYSGYSDGIIQGLDFESDDRFLYLTAGIIKYQNEYYFLNEKIEIMDFSMEGKKVFIYLQPSEEKVENNIKIKELSVVITREKAEGNGFYLGEFLHHQNKPIRTTYQGLEEVNGIGNTMNIVDRKYAGKKGATIDPQILYCYAKSIMDKILATPLDYYIVTQGLNRKTVEIDLLQQYTNNKDCNFNNLYCAFVQKSKEKIKYEEKNDEKQLQAKKTQKYDFCVD